MYGSPVYSGMQEHEPAPLSSLHIALMPHGLGLQGIGISTGGGTTREIIIFLSFDFVR